MHKVCRNILLACCCLATRPLIAEIKAGHYDYDELGGLTVDKATNDGFTFTIDTINSVTFDTCSVEGKATAEAGKPGVYAWKDSDTKSGCALFFEAKPDGVLVSAVPESCGFSYCGNSGPGIDGLFRTHREECTNKALAAVRDQAVKVAKSKSPAAAKKLLEDRLHLCDETMVPLTKAWFHSDLAFFAEKLGDPLGCLTRVTQVGNFMETDTDGPNPDIKRVASALRANAKLCIKRVKSAAFLAKTPLPPGMELACGELTCGLDLDVDGGSQDGRVLPVRNTKDKTLALAFLAANGSTQIFPLPGRRDQAVSELSLLPASGRPSTLKDYKGPVMVVFQPGLKGKEGLRTFIYFDKGAPKVVPPH